MSDNLEKRSDSVAPVRTTLLGVSRILFGLVFAVDAILKWRPDFVDHFKDFVGGALDGQAPWVAAWINGWVNLVSGAPHAFGIIVAIGETAIAIGLIFGVLSNATDIVGMVLSLVIWSTAEGFGGPYGSDATDPGGAIVYFILFLALYATRAGLYLGLDAKLASMMGRWSFLTAGRSNKSKS